MKFTFMTPKGMYGGSFEAADVDEALKIAKEAPWHEDVLDVTESADDGMLLVVADDEPVDLEEPVELPADSFDQDTRDWLLGR